MKITNYTSAILFLPLVLSFCWLEKSENNLLKHHLVKLLQKSIKKKTITFLVAADLHINKDDSLKKTLRPVEALNKVVEAYGRSSHGYLLQGRWPAKTIGSSKTKFKSKRIRKPDFLLIAGDITDSSLKSEIDSFVKSYDEPFSKKKEGLNLAVFPGYGEHDIHTINFLHYLDRKFAKIKHKNFHFNKESRNYAFAVGNFFFIQMNLLSSKHFAWLKKQLARNLEKKIFIIQHYGFDDFSLCKDSVWGLPEKQRQCSRLKRDSMKKWRRLLSLYKVTAIFTGHRHLSGYCIFKAGKNLTPIFSSGSLKDSDSFLLVKASKRLVQVANIRFIGSSENNKLYFTDFAMNSSAYNGDRACRFKSSHAYRAVLGQ